VIANLEHRAELLDLVHNRPEAVWLRGKAAELRASYEKARSATT
jgi:hypothetical protein